jgi:hypothetical protein
MRTPPVRFLLLVALAAGLAGLWAATAAADHVRPVRDPAAQTLAIHDTRTGTGPCGFAVRRDLAGSVSVIPRVDAAGNLVLAVEAASLRGTLTNPATGRTLDLGRVAQSGAAGFASTGGGETLTLALAGEIARAAGDGARTGLAMELPGDGAGRVAYVAGARADDPWSHACGLLADGRDEMGRALLRAAPAAPLADGRDETVRALARTQDD